MNISNFTKPKIIKYAIVVSILSSLPIFIFIINFSNQKISDDITDWSSFGSFVSGTTSLVISVISLIVLGYLTYFVGAQSSSENKKINLLLKKLEAYEMLLSHIPIMTASMDSISWYSHKIIDHYQLTKELQTDFDSSIEKMFEAVREFKQLHHFLISFEDRFSQLFNYDFDSDDFNNLLKYSEISSNFHTVLLIKLQKKEKDIKFLDDIDLKNFLHSLNTFIKALKTEVKVEHFS